VLTLKPLLLVICALLDYYAASSGNFLLTFRDDLSVPPTVGHEDVTERSVRHYRSSLRDNPEEGSSNLLRDGNLL
jgi:hypothetical protein